MSGSASQSFCADSDSGLNPFVPGQMRFEVNGGYGKVNDYCRDEFTLHERYCVSGSDLPARGTDMYCEFGCVSDENGLGACVQANGSVSPSTGFGNPNDVQLPNDYSLDNSGSNNPGNDEPQEFFVASCDFESCDPPQNVPEFSFIAAGIAFLGAGLGYIQLRKRK